jgi:RHS repeat-associated protein
MTQAKPAELENMRRQRTVLLAVDLKNSVLAELDASNPNRMAYSPYGHQSAQQGVMTRLGFNGELLEVKPEWYLLGNGYRAYNTLFMRFHSPDKFSPFGKGGLNAYGYCEGEPVMNSDPTGQSIWALSNRFQFVTGQATRFVTQVIRASASVARNTAIKTASLISRGAIKFSDALGKAKKTLIDGAIGSEPFLRPPKYQAKQKNKLTQETKPEIFSARLRIQKPESKTQYQPATSSDYHVEQSKSILQHTPLIHEKTGKIVAVIRTGPSVPK